jgi:hypothetical protein
LKTKNSRIREQLGEIVPMAYSVYAASRLVGCSEKTLREYASGYRVPEDGRRMRIVEIPGASGRTKRLIPLDELKRVFPGLWPETAPCTPQEPKPA